MKNTIKPGDRVTLSPVNGLGCGTVLVLEVDPREIIQQLYVRGRNGETWWARSEGAKIVH